MSKRPCIYRSHIQ